MLFDLAVCLFYDLFAFTPHPRYLFVKYLDSLGEVLEDDDLGKMVQVITQAHRTDVSFTVGTIAYDLLEVVRTGTAHM